MLKVTPSLFVTKPLADGHAAFFLLASLSSVPLSTTHFHIITTPITHRLANRLQIYMNGHTKEGS